MRRSWERSQIEVIHSTVTAEEYNRLLEEWAEVVYLHLCQLSEIDTLVPIQTALNEQKRTGTDG